MARNINQKITEYTMGVLASDIGYLKAGVDKMLVKQDITNGRVNKLEMESRQYITRQEYDEDKIKESNAENAKETKFGDRFRDFGFVILGAVISLVMTYLFTKLVGGG